MRFQIVLPLLICCMVSTSIAEEKTSTQTVKVLSFNLQHGVGLDGRYDLKGIGEFIKQQNAEIVALQEVDRNYSRRSNNDDQPLKLAQQLGFVHFFGANIDNKHGNLLLSEHGFIKVRNHLFNKAPHQRKRSGIIAATVKIGEHKVRIYNTQLDSSSRPVRVGQLNRIVQLLQAEKLPFILCGDFNTQSKEQLKRLTSYSTAEKVAVEGGFRIMMGERPWLVSVRSLKKMPGSNEDIFLSPDLEEALMETHEIPSSDAKRKALCITLDLSVLKKYADNTLVDY